MPNTPFEDILNKVATPEFGKFNEGATYNDFLKAVQTNLGTKGTELAPQRISPFEVDISGRYPKQALGMDNEDLYAQGQSGLDQIVNGLLKGLNLVGTTFLQGTVGLLNGTLQAIADGKFSSFYDNEFSRALDQWNKKLEDQWLPNYYSAAERERPWYKNIMTANFLGDKFIKNLGFMGGAALSGGMFAKILGSFGRASVAGNMLKAVDATEEAIRTGKNAVQLEQQLRNLATGYNALNKGQRAIVAGLATAGEASIASLQAADEFRNKLIEEYRVNNGGILPTGEALEKIDNAAANVGNTVFGLNALVLTASNYIQFPRLLASSQKAERSMFADTVRETNRVRFNPKTLKYEEVLPTTRFGKLTKFVGDKSAYVFSGTEALEEGLQTAAQVGSENYWYKKYQAGDEMDLNFINGVSELFKKDAVSELYGTGIDAMINTDEGQEALFLGGISGGIGKARGTYSARKRKDEATADLISKSKKASIGDMVKNLSPYTKETMDAVKRGAEIQQVMEASTRQGDVLEYKDAEADYLINLVTPKIKYGKLDLLDEEINTYRQLASTEEGYQQLVEDGKALSTDTRQSYLMRLDNIQRFAKSMQTAYEAFKVATAFEFAKDKNGDVIKDSKGRPIAAYSDKQVDQIIYTAAKIMDYDKRIPELETSLIAAGVDVLKIYEDTEEAKKAFDLIDKLTNIAGKTVTDEVKKDLKNTLSDVLELDARRKLYVKEHNEILSNPRKFDEKPQAKATTAQVVTVKTKEGDLEIKVGSKYLVGEIDVDTKQGFVSKKFPQFEVLALNEDGTIKIKFSDGSTSNVSKDYFSKYKIGTFSAIQKNKKAWYWYKNKDRIFRHFGIKDSSGKPVEGVLRWSDEENSLFFEYFQNNRRRLIRVSNKDFVAKPGYKQGMVVPTNQTLQDIEDANELQTEEEKLEEKLDRRKQIIVNLVNNKRDRLDEVKDTIKKNYEKLEEIDESLDNLKKTKGGLPRKRFTKAIRKTLNELAAQRKKIVEETQELVFERDELFQTIPYLENILRSYQELPINTLEMVEEMKQDVANLQALLEVTEKAIEDNNTILSKIDEVLRQAYDLLNDYIKRIKEENPEFPLDLEAYQEKLEKYLGEEGARMFIENNEGFTQNIKLLLADIAEFSEELEININEKKIEAIENEIDSLKKLYKDFQGELSAKSAVLDTFEKAIQDEKNRRVEEEKLAKNQQLMQEIFKAASKAEVSSGNTGGTDATVTERTIKGALQLKKPISRIASTTSRDEDRNPDEMVDPMVVRERNFLYNQNFFPDNTRENIKVRVVSVNTEAEFGLSGLVEMSARQNKEGGWDTLPKEELDKILNDADKGVLLAVYILEKDGIEYFIDENGKTLGKVGEEIDLNKVVASTLTSTSLETKRDGKRYQDADKDVLESHQADWKKERGSLIEGSKVYDVFFSRGLPVYTIKDGKMVFQPLSESFEDDKLQTLKDTEGSIIVVTDNQFKLNDIVVKSEKGQVFLQHNSIFVPLTNRKLNSSEQDTLFEVLVKLAEQALTERKFKGELLDYLQGMLLWGTPKDNKPYKNQIWISTDNGLELNLGNTGKKVPFGPSSLQQSENKAIVMAYLAGTYNNINNFILETKSDKEFIEYILEAGELKTKTHKNYQSFIIDKGLVNSPLSSGRNIKQIYSVLKDIEFRQPEQKKKVEKQQEEEEQDEDFEEGDKQIFSVKTASGFEIKYEMQGDDPYVLPDDEQSKEYRETKKKIVAATDEETFNSNVITYVFKDVDEREAAKKVTPKPQKPTSDIEAKKADIERRRREELDNVKPVYHHTQVKPEDFDFSSFQRGTKSISQFGDGLNASSNTTSFLVNRYGNPIQGEVNDKDFVEIDANKTEKELYEYLKSKGYKFSKPASNYTGNEKANYQPAIIELFEDFQKNNPEVKGVKVSNHVIAGTMMKPFYVIYDSKSFYGQDSLKNEINAKYDAELAELEKQVEQPTKPQTKRKDRLNLGENDEDDSFRVVDLLRVERMSEQEKQEFKKWVSENLPQFTVEEVEELIRTAGNAAAWGKMSGSVLTFYKLAEKGTGYHEAFEAVWKYFATPEEKEFILEEFKNREGVFRDRVSGQTISYAEATDSQAKEKLADEFAEYKLGKKKESWISRLFGRIIKFFRTFLRRFKENTSLRDKLFEKISEGGFKKYKLPAKLSTEEEYSRVPGLSEAEIQAFVQDMAKSFFNQLIREGVDLMEGSTYTERTDILKNIRERYIKSSGFRTIPDYEKVYSLLETEFKDYLKTMKIEFDENNEFYILDENRNNRDYVDDKFQLDVKKSSPFAIRFLLASLAKTKGYNAATGKIEFDTDGAVLGLRQLIPFNRTFITMLESIVNSTSFEDAVNKIEALGRRNNDFKALLNILGANKGTFDLSNLKEHQWRLLSSIYRTFNLQKPEVSTLTYAEDGDVYFSDAHFGRPTKQLINQWQNNISRKINSGESKFFKKNQNGEFTYVPKSVDAYGATSSEEILFLNELGINITFEDYQKLNPKERSIVGNAVIAIKTYIPKAKPFKIARAKYLEVSGQISKIAEVISKNQRVLSETTFVNPDGKQQQAFVQPNYFSTITNIFNSVLTLDELFERLPHLKYDEFSKNSLILKKDGRYFDKSGNRTKLKLTVGYIGGQEKDEKGRKLDNLSGPDRLMAQINGVLEEKHYISVPADSSTEWNINLLNFISDSQAVEKSQFESKFLEIFKGYLQDEIDLISDKSRAKNDNVGSKWKNLRFFRTILSPETVSKIEKTKEIPKEVDHEIIEWFYGITSKLRDTLEYNSQLQQINENLFTIPGLLSEYTRDSKTFSERELQGFLNYVSANTAIANMEFHKVFFGDPYNFQIKKDGTLDETKRIKSFGSPAIPLFTNKHYNNTFKKKFNEGLKSSDFGYYAPSDYIKTTTYSDVKIVSDYLDYEDVVEPDAAAIHSIFFERDLQNRLGKWGQAEKDWFEWEMAFTRNSLFKKEVISEKEYSKELQKRDVETLKKPQPKAKFDVKKPIVRGVKNNPDYTDTILDKFSSSPIWYSGVEGTHLEDLFIKMYREKIDYVIFESGRKVGSEGKNDFYEGTKFNNNPYKGVFQIKWDQYYLQVENNYEEGKKQPRGSQITKLFSSDMFIDGVPIDYQGDNWYELSEEEKEKNSQIYRDVKLNNELLEQMTDIGYRELLNKLGIEETENGFEVVNQKKLYKTLADEAMKRDMPANLKKIFLINEETGEPYFTIDKSAKYDEIVKMLYSMVDKTIISPKVNGGAHVQIPATGWESKALGRSIAIKENGQWKKITQEEYENLGDKSKAVLTSSRLKFYTKEKPWMEILLPNWMKDLGLSDSEVLTKLSSSPELLKAIGFRIPTQGMSAIENIRIAGFLPEEYGNTVVVPSEITTKAGSDFDIDKLNLYLKNAYLTKDGKLKQHELYDVPKGGAVRDFYEEHLLERYKKFRNKEKVSEIELSADELFETAGLKSDEDIIIQKLQSQYIPSIEEFEIEVANLTKMEFNRRYNPFFKKAIENEYFDSIERVISNPLNFDRLTRPLDDPQLKNIASDLAKINGTEESKKLSSLLDINYLNNLRNTFLMAKKWVGIGAINITGHSQAQRANLYIDVNDPNLSEEDKNMIKGEILLPHNKTKDGKPSLSKALDQDGKYISDVLSSYLNAFVDVAKDPYILQIIYDRKIVDIYMFLARIGVPAETVAYFMNQPIIKEYVHFSNLEGFSSLASSYRKEMFLENSKYNGKPAQKLTKNLKDQITNPTNDQQLLIFNEFLKYAKLASFSFRFTNATKWDTTRFTSGGQIRRMELMLEKPNPIKSPSQVLEASNNGVVYDRVTRAKKAIEALSPISETSIRTELDKILDTYLVQDFLMPDELEKIDNQLVKSFIDYLVQVRHKISAERYAYDAIKKVSEVLNNPAKREEFNNNPIFDMFMIKSALVPGGTEQLTIAPFPKSPYEKNQIGAYFEELKELNLNSSGEIIPGSLYDNLLKLSILQGIGKYNNLLPYVNPFDVAKYLKVTPTKADAIKFVKDSKFQTANWKDNDIVPYGKWLHEDNVFPDVRVIKLSTQFSRELTEHDVVKFDKFPRIRKKGSKRIDLTNYTTKNTITKDVVDRMKEKKDFSFLEKVGYKKIMDGDKPFTTKGQKPDELIYYYYQVNLTGDGNVQDFSSVSAFPNGTLRIEELLDNERALAYVKQQLASAKKVTQPELKSSTVDIYSELGNKTRSENVVIKSWGELKDAKEAIIKNNLPTKDVKVNIYAGANQNTELSNFAIRPFTTNVETSSGSKTYTFKSVEQGFHFYKAIIANNLQVAAQILKTTNGGALRNLTNRSNLPMTSEQVKEWDGTSKSIMLNLMYDSYLQNPDAAQKLLATGDATITHTQDNTRWKLDFPEVVMAVREMLKEEGFKSSQSTVQKTYNLGRTGVVKQGVSELFESNPELANQVYEALGFDKQINEIADTKKVDEFITKYKDALPNIKDGKTLISHLQTVSNRNTETTKQFADLIIKLAKSNKSLEKLLNNPNLYAKPNGVGDEGAFHWSLLSNLSVNKIVLELDHFKTNTYDDVFLHELIHNLTTQFIVKDSDLFNQDFYNKVKSLYDVFDKHLEQNRKLNKPLIENLSKELQNYKKVKEYFEFLPEDAIQQELIFGKIGSVSTVKEAKLDFKNYEGKSKQEVLNKLNEVIKFKEDNLKEREKGEKDYYYFNSKTFKKESVLSEFLATFMNDANFREQLKTIDYKNDKSIFQSIIDLISEFIGLTKNDSLYNEFILTLTNFINNNDYSAIAKQTQKTAYQNRIKLLEQQKQQAQQLYSQYLDTIGVTDIGYHHSESDLESFTTFSEGYFPKELKKKGTYYKEADDIVFFVKKPLTEEFMSKRKFIGTWGLKIPNTLQFNTGEKVGEGVHPGIDEGIKNAVNGKYDAVDFGRIRDNKTWSEVVAITNPKNAVKLGSKQDVERFKKFVSNLYISNNDINSSNVYSYLGGVTKSTNVVIMPWASIKALTKSIYEDKVVSTRIPNTSEHFGNPYSHEPQGKAAGLIKTDTIKEAVEKYIDWVINSSDSRAIWVREQLKSGKLKGKSIIYYKELGEPSHATALDYLINKYSWDKTDNQEDPFKCQ